MNLLTVLVQGSKTAILSNTGSVSKKNTVLVDESRVSDLAACFNTKLGIYVHRVVKRASLQQLTTGKKQ